MVKSKYDKRISLIEWLLLACLEILVTCFSISMIFVIDALNYAYISGLIAVDLLMAWLFLDAKRN